MRPALYSLRNRRIRCLYIARQIDDVDIDSDDIGNGNGIKGVLFDAAIFIVVVIFPVLHEHAADLMALLFEQGAVTDESTPPERPTMMFVGVLVVFMRGMWVLNTFFKA